MSMMARGVVLMLRLTILVDAEALDEGHRELLGLAVDAVLGPSAVVSDVERVQGRHRGASVVSAVERGPDVSSCQLSMFRELQSSHEWPVYHQDIVI